MDTVKWLNKILFYIFICFIFYVWGYNSAPDYIDDYTCTVTEEYYSLNGTLDYYSEHDCYYEYLSWNQNETEYHNVKEKITWRKKND